MRTLRFDSLSVTLIIALVGCGSDPAASAEPMADAGLRGDAGEPTSLDAASHDARLASPEAATLTPTLDAASALDASAARSVCQRPQPGPDNTGVPKGTQLKASKSITVKTDGAIVEDLEIDGAITVLANNVTIRRVHIRSGDYYPIRYFDNDNTGLVVEDSEIEGTSGDVTSGLAFAHYTARRLNIHGSADGLKSDEDVLIEDCWIHDLSNGDGEHNDGVQSTGGKGVTIRHNSISGASNACVQTGDEGAATEDLVIDCNWLGGGGYTLNIRGTGATRPKNTQVTNNLFSKDAAYGPWTIDDPSPEVRGNVYSDGTPIAFP